MYSYRLTVSTYKYGFATNKFHNFILIQPLPLATGIGPEMMVFEDGEFVRTGSSDFNKYLLRPETVESYFYHWRLTHDQKYREWGWQAALVFCFNFSLSISSFNVSRLSVYRKYRTYSLKNFGGQFLV